MIRLLEAERTKPGISLDEFKRTAHQLKDLAAGQVKLGNIHQMLAAAYGYKTYAALQAAAVNGYAKRKED